MLNGSLCSCVVSFCIACLLVVGEQHWCRGSGDVLFAIVAVLVRSFALQGCSSVVLSGSFCAFNEWAAAIVACCVSGVEI